MRNLKKVLSLVLVVAMIASMLIVGAAAAEAEETLYDEAAAVVSGIGIFEGDEGGYRYKDTITREEAAKVIAHIMLGDTAETLPLTTAPFADVAAGRWSAGYIAYLKSNGVISGVTDTTFDPTADVTGVAFAKMMLAAVGYGKAGEFEGADWDINTVTRANQLGVFADAKDVDFGSAATREECMLYAFNTLTKVPTVSYNKTLETYYTGNSALNNITGKVDPKNTDPTSSPYAYTLAWLNYGLRLTNLTKSDDFGRPAVTWTADDVKIADTVVTAKPDEIFYGYVGSAQIYNLLGKSAIKDIEEKNGYDEFTIYWDGVEKDADALIVDGPIKAGHFENYITLAGATTEAYVSYEGGVYDVTFVSYNAHIAEVQKVSASKNQITIKDLKDNKSFTLSGDDFDITPYGKEDYVLYTRYSEDDGTTFSAASIVGVQPVVGTMTGRTSLGGPIVDGVSKSSAAYTASKPLQIGVAYEIYYDAQGNIMAADVYDEAGATDTYKYFYVKASQAQAKNSDLINGSVPTVAYDVVYANGGNEVVYGAVKNTSSTYYVMVDGAKKEITTDVDKDFVPAGWYSYTANEAGEVSIKAVDAKLNGADINVYASQKNKVEVDTGKYTTETDYTADSKTVLTVVNEDGVCATYTGIANFPEDFKYSETNAVLVLHAQDTKLAKAIVVYYGDNKVEGNANYAYILAASTLDDENVTYATYVDGAFQMITLPQGNVTLTVKGVEYPHGGFAYIMYQVAELSMVDGEYALNIPYDNVKNNAGMDSYGTGDGDWFFDAMNIAQWYEDAIIDTVDENYFTTVEVTEATAEYAELLKMENKLKELKDDLKDLGLDPEEDYDVNEATDPTEAGKIDGEIALLEKDIADLEKVIAELLADYNAVTPISAETWYYDDDTVIYDCVNGGLATELSSGDAFIAVMDDTDTEYCTHIWIVG